MATFATYAEVLTPQHSQYKAYQAGIKKNPPGILLQKILNDNDGAYEAKVALSGKFRELLQRVGELTSDQRLLDLASKSEVPVSLEHLRYVDPATTRIVFGYRFDVTPEESERLNLKHQGSFDPKNSMKIRNT